MSSTPTSSAQVGSVTAAGPTAGTVVATVTPGAGIWEITGTVSVTGVSVVAAESNNVRLRQNTNPLLANIPMPCTTAGSGVPVTFGPVLATTDADDTINVIVIANATATAIYAAQICCKRVD